MPGISYNASRIDVVVVAETRFSTTYTPIVGIFDLADKAVVSLAFADGASRKAHEPHLLVMS